jgi:hypothetical protein
MSKHKANYAPEDSYNSIGGALRAIMPLAAATGLAALVACAPLKDVGRRADNAYSNWGMNVGVADSGRDISAHTTHYDLQGYLANSEQEQAFLKHLPKFEGSLKSVISKYVPETGTVDGILKHIKAGEFHDAANTFAYSISDEARKRLEGDGIVLNRETDAFKVFWGGVVPTAILGNAFYQGVFNGSSGSSVGGAPSGGTPIPPGGS